MRLTRDEIRLIVGILVALLTGAIVKHSRDKARAELTVVPAAAAVKSVSTAH